MLRIQEKENMINFLVNYFEKDINQLMNLRDENLEMIYDHAYYQTELERDL
jgi:hypothetical protein